MKKVELYAIISSRQKIVKPMLKSLRVGGNMNITIDQLTKTTIQYFIKKINDGLSINRMDRCIEINFNATAPFPENLVPICGVIDYLKEIGFRIKVLYPKDSRLLQSGLSNPYKLPLNDYDLLSPTNRIWRYNTPEEVFKIVSAFVNHLNSKTVCAKGVVESFEWTINEIMDNVIQHSRSKYGYIMCTVYSNSHISVAIFDNGIGILQSFKGSKYRLRSPFDAIELAMRENTTRDPKIGQGNGMWGMKKIVNNNKGILSITSSGVNISINEHDTVLKHELKNKSIRMKTPYHLGTLVDFQFNCNNEICLSDIFGKNYEYTNLTLENLEDDQNRINVKISQFSFGCATRLAGESARNLVLNYLVQSNYSQIIILDFSGVSIIASSFADEFIGKLLQECGFIQFNNLIRITNISKENNRSVMQRISEND